MSSITLSGGAVLQNNIIVEMAETAATSAQICSTSPSLSSATFDFSSQIVTVRVGASKTKYYIHKDVLTSRSHYFNNALTGNGATVGDRAPNTNTLDLPADDESTFKLLINWLYTGSASTPGGSSPSPQDLFKLWILADSKAMQDLQNHCIDAIPDAIVRNWGKSKTNWANSLFVRWVWSNTQPTSRLRDFLVEMYAVSIKASTIVFTGWPPNFLIRLLKRIGDEGSKGEGPLGSFFGEVRKSVLQDFDTGRFHEPMGEESEQLPSYEDACSS